MHADSPNGELVISHIEASIKVLQSDGGGEYISASLHQFMSSKGIIHHKSCPYTPDQNGLAERKNRHLVKITQCILLGFASQYKGYICFDSITRKLIFSRHVLFDETVFPSCKSKPLCSPCVSTSSETSS